MRRDAGVTNVGRRFGPAFAPRGRRTQAEEEAARDAEAAARPPTPPTPTPAAPPAAKAPAPAPIKKAPARTKLVGVVETIRVEVADAAAAGGSETLTLPDGPAVGAETFDASLHRGQ